MDPDDKNLLILNRPALVDNIDVNNGLFNHLLSLKVLNSRMVQTITYNKPPDKQVEELLDILPKRGQDAFKLFCEALIKSDQENVVTSFLQKKGDHKTPSISTCHINNTCVGGFLNLIVSLFLFLILINLSGLVSTPPLLTSEVQSSFVSLQTNSQKRKPDHIPENKPTENVDDAEFISSEVSSPQKRVCSNTASIIRITGNDHKDIFKIFNSETPISTSNIVQTAPLEDSSYTKDEVRYAMKHYVTTDTPEEKSQDSVNQKAMIFLSKLEGKYDRQISSKQNCHNLLRISPKEWLSRWDSADTMERRPTHLPNDASHLYLPGHNFSCEKLCNKSIDLTDGSVAVRVEPCTRQFYEANKHKSYRMIAKPRGQALIINVNEVYDKPPRRGTNIDRDNLHNLLMQLEFIVTVYNDEDDLTAQGIVNKLRAFASLSEHKKGDASIICLLSHGEEGYIFGTDGKRIPLDETFQLFDNQHCPALLNKPKVFFIQACRGGALDHGVRLQMDEPDGGPKINCSAQLPSMSDMLVCYPTQEGYYAWRNRERGSWYIEAVVQIFMSHSKCEDICAMLNRVNELVSRKVSRCPHAEMDSMSQMSEFKSSLRRPYLFFFPGIVSPLD